MKETPRSPHHADSLSSAAITISTPLGDDQPDPREAITIYTNQRQHVWHQLTFLSRVLYLIWGLSWLIGYGALWLGSRGDASAPPTWAFTIFNICIIAAVVVTIILAIRNSRGTSGATSTAGGIWGATWAVAFPVGMFTIIWFSQSYQLPSEVLGLLTCILATLLTGSLYMAGAAIWRDRAMLIIGAWMLIICAVSTIAGLPSTFLILSLAGGGGMILGFAWETWWARHHLTTKAEG